MAGVRPPPPLDGRDPRVAVVLLAAATVGGLFAPVVAVLVLLTITVALLVDPLRHTRRPRDPLPNR
jgi:hypothetical protein